MATIAVVGLGCVGLPLVVEFGKTTRTIGFDSGRIPIRAQRLEAPLRSPHAGNRPRLAFGASGLHRVDAVGHQLPGSRVRGPRERA